MAEELPLQHFREFYYNKYFQYKENMTANMWNTGIPVGFSNGGTNATTLATNTGIVKYDGTRLVTSATALLDAGNISIKSSQPFFSAYKSAQTANVTGEGTYYSYICNTELYDVGGNYNNATGIFTAPVTGCYLFQASAGLGGITIPYIFDILIVTTSSTYLERWSRPYNAQWYVSQIVTLANMTAGDTAKPQVRSYGEAAKTDDLEGNGDFRTGFQGYLLT